MTLRRSLIGWQLLAVVCGCLVARAPAADEQAAPLKYRRYLVPADRPKDWPKPNVAYLPIERTEFERLVESANSLPPDHAGSLAARPTRARYTAALEGTLLRGEARFEIAHTAENPVMMSLAPLGLFVEDMRWDTSPPKEVVAGVSATGDTAIVVEQSGSLVIRWSLTGSRDANGMLIFPLELPECAVASFAVDLPEGKMASLLAGVPSRRKAEPVAPAPRVAARSADGAELPQVSAPRQTAAGGERGRWEFAIGERSRLSLVVGPDEATSERERLTLLQESVSYRFSPGGLEVVAQLILDVHHEPLSELRLDLDPELRLVGAQYGSEEVSWSDGLPPGGDSARQAGQVTLDFREPLLGPGRRLTVTALAPLVMDRDWELPRVRVRGAFWQEGTAALLVPAPLSLDDLQPLGCRQSNAAPLRSGRTGEAIELQMFSAEATAKVLLSWKKQAVQLAKLTTVEVSPDGLRGELRGRFRVNEGEVFVLQGVVGEGWLIDSVTATPAAAVSSWNVADAGGKQSVVAHLRGPLSPDRPVELIIAGRHASGLNQPLPSDTFSMVSFGEATLEADLLALEAGGAHQLRFEGARPPRAAESDSLPESIAPFIGDRPLQDLLDLSSGLPEWFLVLKRQRPRFDAQCRAIVSLSNGQFSHEFVVGITPDDSRLDRLTVQFTSPIGPLDWSTDPDLGPISAQLVATEPPYGQTTIDQHGPFEHQGGKVAMEVAASSGRSWEVRLGRATDSPFVLHAVRRESTTDENSPRRARATLVALPDAMAQQGVLDVRLDSASAAVLPAERLTPAPPSEDDEQSAKPGDDRGATWRYTYRYDPLVELGASLPPAAIIDAAAVGGLTAPAIVWRMHVHSQFASSGQARHWAVCNVENLSSSLCRLTLPERCGLQAASVDGEPIALSDNREVLEVPLAGKRRFLTIALEYTSQEKPLGILADITPVWPQYEGPEMARVWTVSLPPAYGPWHGRANSESDLPRRLFGPLARPREREPFNLVRRDDWLGLSEASHDAPARSHADEFLELLGSAYAKAPMKPSWMLLLDAVEQGARAAPPTLLIDAPAMAELGIEPAGIATLGDRFSIPSATSADVRASAARLLLANGLALLVGPEHLVLTSEARAGQETRQRLRPEPNICSWDGPAQAATALEFDDRRYVPWTRWRRSPSSPWAGRAGDEPSFAGVSHGNCYRIDIAGGPYRTARFVHTAALASASWALGAVVAALGLQLALRSRRRWLVLAAVVAIAAAWLPSGLAPLASAAWLGLLGSIVWRIVFASPMRPAAAITESEERPSASAATAGLALSLVCLVSAGSAAAQTAGVVAEPTSQSAQERPAPAKPTVHRVFIPVDADGEQTGHYQAPTAFLDELRRRADAATDRLRGYLVSGARYRCSLAYDDDTGRLEIAEFVARYQLHALTSNVRVSLALRRDTTGLLADSATLDGLPIEPRWTATGDAIVCDLMEPGSYQLELRLLPPTADLGDVTALDMPIPIEPSSTLDVSLPADLPSVAVFGARGATRRSADGRQLTAGLGPVSRLSLRWPQRTMSTAPEFEVEELLWLKVRPGSVVLDARLNYRVTSGTLRQVELVADRRLRCIPSGSAAPGSVETLPGDPDLPGSPQTIKIHLDEPVTDRCSLNLSLLLTESSGVGNLRLPNVRAIAARSTKRWLAVTVDPPGLEYDIRNDGQLERLTPNEFAKGWGGEHDQAALGDALVYRLPAAETDWSLATRPREPQTTAKETLSLSFDRDRALVQYDGELMTTAGYVFQHRLRVPPRLEIESVSLSDAEGGADRVARWARDSQGIVSVFLASPTTGPQRLVLRGRMAWEPDVEAALPVIALESCDPRATIEEVETLARAVHIYRQPSVSVTLDGISGLEATDQRPAELASDRWGRLVASFQAKPDFTAKVRVTPNEPRIAAVEQVTSLRYLDQGWLAVVDLKLQLDGGQLDALRFDVPADWSKAVEVSKPATLEIDEQPGKNRKQLIIRPLVPLEGECRIRLQAPLHFAAGEPIASPDIVPLSMGEVRRFWALPTRMGLQPVFWEPTRLVPAAAPPWFDSSLSTLDATPQSDSKPAGPSLASPAEDEQVVYRAVGEDPLAVLNIPRPTTDVAQIRLGEIFVRWRHDEPCEAAAAFDLEPGGLTACPMRLAAGWRIVSLSVDGAPLAAQAMGDDTVKVPLRSNRLPQRIELALTGPADAPIAMSPVWPGDIPVQASLFTVMPPSSWRVTPAAAQAEIIDAATCARARLDATVALIDLSPEVLAITPVEEISAWYRPWARRLLACDASWRGENQPGLGERLPTDQSLLDGSRIADAWRKTARKLGTQSILTAAARRRPVASSALDLWLSQHAGEPAIHCRSTSSGRMAPLRLITDQRQPNYQQVLVSISIGLLLLAVVALTSVPLVSDGPRRWPQVIGVALGLAWWLWLQPSVFGWLIVAYSLLSAWRSAWKPSWS